jgi:hypothetical protein
MTESTRDEHARLQRRTAELREAHAALALDRQPFDQVQHDQHSARLAAHKRDLAAHKAGRTTRSRNLQTERTVGNARCEEFSRMAPIGLTLAAGPARTTAPDERKQGHAMDTRKTSDTSHQNDQRGEHRYPDTHQKPSEQDARHSRDALKARLGEDKGTRRQGDGKDKALDPS